MTKKFTIEVEMEERWIDDFCSMLETMMADGDIGHSELIGFFSDGDGDFRPKFNINTEYNFKPGITDRKYLKEKRCEIIYDAC